MKACMKLGIGITLCPEISFRNEIKTGEFVRLGWDITDTETSIIMISHTQKWRSPLLNQFINIAEEEMSG
jgi:DNA-binding transcriptional LysR family regulator